MPLPDNAVQIIDDILWCSSRLRSMAHSELIAGMDEAEQRIMLKIMDDLFPYISSNRMVDSIIIDACGEFLESKQPMLFYNIITMYWRTPSLDYIMTFMAGRGAGYIPQPDIRWVIEP